jgi:hypothetical protein
MDRASREVSVKQIIIEIISGSLRLHKDHGAGWRMAQQDVLQSLPLVHFVNIENRLGDVTGGPSDPERIERKRTCFSISNNRSIRICAQEKSHACHILPSNTETTVVVLQKVAS